MFGLRTLFLLSLSSGVLTTPLSSRNGCATAGVTPGSFAAETFDYIVVGGGTAGLTVATRLAKGTRFKVGVIEAGDYYPDEPKINVPGLFGSIVGDPKFDWMHVTTPQTGLADGVQPLPRGKLLGGTSAMNTMGWNRATSKEYDAWEAFGNPGWNWQTLLGFFKRLEHVTPAPKATPPEFLYTFNPAFHGFDGPVKVSYPKWSSDIIPVVFKTMRAWGLLPDADPSDGTNIGAVSLQNSINIRNSTRSYSASAYYASCRCANLVVLGNATATKINFAPKPDHKGNLAAKSVTFSSNNRTYTVNVAKEVIVSGGTYNTPQILELSGIGDKDIVSRAGVKSIIDLPGVGENLQDHMQLSLRPMELVDGFTTRDILRDTAQAGLYMDEYNEHKTGPYSSSLVSVAYLPLSSFVDKPTRDSLLSDLDTELTAASSKLAPADKLTYPIQRKWLDGEDVAVLEILILPFFVSSDPTVKPKANTSYVTLVVGHQHTFSRGSSHITSNDGLAQPSIDPKYFSWKFDKKVVIEAAKYGIKFGTKEPLKSAIAVDPYDSTWTDSFIENYVTNFTTSMSHPVGTAALLPRSQGGVVDPNLLVYGTTNVRVADASVIPNHISAHIMATVYAIAEFAAKTILADM